MKRDFLISGLLVLMVSFSAVGCATFVNDELHDEILTYEVPFDRGYLQILETGSELPGWTLESTLKSEGLLSFRQKGATGDLVTLIVRNLDKKLISLEVAKGSQQVHGVGLLLKEVDKRFLEKQKAQDREDK